MNSDRVLDMPEKLFSCRSCFHFKKEKVKVITESGKFICQKCDSLIELHKARCK